MNIKTPFGGDLEFQPDLCSRVLPDDDGVLKTGYVATCPKTEQQFEVCLTITGCGTDQEHATIEGKELPIPAQLAQRRNVVADKARARAAPQADAAADAVVEKMVAVAVAAGLKLSEPMQVKLKRTAVRDLLRDAAAAPLAKHDQQVTTELKQKTVADKELAEAAISRLET